MADVTMPQLGETVTEGTITKWFKQIGDEVKADEPLFEVSTDKVDTEVPSPIAGTLVETLTFASNAYVCLDQPPMILVMASTSIFSRVTPAPLQKSLQP